MIALFKRFWEVYCRNFEKLYGPCIKAGVSPFI